MKQTAVEWLIEQVNGYSYPILYNQNIRIDIPKEIIEQAKALEKEQIRMAFVDGRWSGQFEKSTSEEYYIEKYKK